MSGNIEENLIYAVARPTGTFQNIASARKAISVKEGDRIYLRARTQDDVNGGATVRAETLYTFLTVEEI